MFAKRDKIQPLERPPQASGHRLAAVDLTASASGILIAGLGAVQALAPQIVQVLTALEPGVASAVIGVQWILLGAFLLASGMTKSRAAAALAAECTLICSFSALLVVVILTPELMPMIVHGGIAFLGFVSSGFARLTDRADMKRELSFARASAEEARRSQDEIELPQR